MSTTAQQQQQEPGYVQLPPPVQQQQQAGVSVEEATHQHQLQECAGMVLQAAGGSMPGVYSGAPQQGWAQRAEAPQVEHVQQEC